MLSTPPTQNGDYESLVELKQQISIFVNLRCAGL